MKQSSLKKRHISHLQHEPLLETVQRFLPPPQTAEKSLKNRVQVLVNRAPWNSEASLGLEEPQQKTV